MPAVPLFSLILSLQSETGCTRDEADLAVRRAGYAANRNELLEAVKLEQAISNLQKIGESPLNVLITASQKGREVSEDLCAPAR